MVYPLSDLDQRQLINSIDYRLQTFFYFNVNSSFMYTEGIFILHTPTYSEDGEEEHCRSEKHCFYKVRGRHLVTVI